MSDGILARWSRRKQAVRVAERDAAPPIPMPEAAPAVIEDAPDAPTDEADALADAIARLPRLEDLTSDTDLVPFLRAGIPRALRNAALRKMWSLDPSIRDFVSEAREYAYDWNTPGGVPGLGPMLPTDDIPGMVERIMTGHAPVPPLPEPTPPPEDDDVGGEDVNVVATADLDDASSEPDRERGATGQLVPAPPPAEAFQSPTIVSRLRRHGGAMPS